MLIACLIGVILATGFLIIAIARGCYDTVQRPFSGAVRGIYARRVRPIPAGAYTAQRTGRSSRNLRALDDSYPFGGQHAPARHYQRRAVHGCVHRDTGHAAEVE